MSLIHVCIFIETKEAVLEGRAGACEREEIWKKS